MQGPLLRLAVICAVALPAVAGDPPGAELVGHAVLPADTFAPGPPSGAFGRDGTRSAPRFARPPLQGISAIRRTGPNAFLALSDNGFGTRLNSPDYPLRLYTLRPNLRTPGGGSGIVTVDPAFVSLRDPGRLLTFLVVHEHVPGRLLTGGDLDPESLVIGADGTLWIGDELGPFILHFDPTGRLIDPPIALPDRGAIGPTPAAVLRSPDNPFLVPPQPRQRSEATAGRSKGLESMAQSPDGSCLYALLEGPVLSDRLDRLRLYELDLATRRFCGPERTYRMESPAHAVRDMATVSRSVLLVVEVDEGHGPLARFKKVYAIDLSGRDTRGDVPKEEVVDLMRVRDPHRLGRVGPVFTMPYQCIEGLEVLDRRTLLVVNDNNYPAAGARRVGQRDGTELAVIRLDRPLPVGPVRGLSPDR